MDLFSLELCLMTQNEYILWLKDQQEIESDTKLENWEMFE